MKKEVMKVAAKMALAAVMALIQAIDKWVAKKQSRPKGKISVVFSFLEEYTVSIINTAEGITWDYHFRIFWMKFAMTMDLYAHVLPDQKAEEIRKKANLF